MLPSLSSLATLTLARVNCRTQEPDAPRGGGGGECEELPARVSGVGGGDEVCRLAGYERCIEGRVSGVAAPSPHPLPTKASSQPSTHTPAAAIDG
ncbi:hypothetical protein E2C01_051799 [Portunus trituberculatus]|uniref:Uncharacterized protein n=1 Tax=Portunus trituberculatus TaxID=210409 RepID=A0A5B7GCS3_PORTR|nr:hypothetical protein [Portunus trituberculatus]